MNKYVLLIIILLLGCFLFYSLIQFFPAFLGSVVLYELTKSMMRNLTVRKRWNKSLSAALIMIMTFVIIMIPVLLLGTLLYSKIAAIVGNPKPIMDALQQLDGFIQEKLHFEIISDQTLQSLPGIGTRILGVVLTTGANAFTTIGMMYFFLYFMLVNSSRMEAALILFLPFTRSKLKMLGRELHAQTISNAVGVPLVAVAQGLCGYGAYLLAGVPEAGFWGLLTGLASIIPVVGATVIWGPVVIYLLFMHMIWQAVAVLLICLFILGTVDNVIRFLLAKKMADVHPVITILGIIMGLNLFGLSGIIFGPLLISYFFIFIKLYYLDYQKADGAGFKPAPMVKQPVLELSPFLFRFRSGHKRKKA